MVGFTGVPEFFTYSLQLSVIVLLEAHFGHFLEYLLPSLEVASVVVVIINNFLILFNGFNPPASSIPRGYKCLNDIIPTKYRFASLTAVIFGDCPAGGDDSARGCQRMTGTPPSLADGITVKYLETTFLVRHDQIWSNLAIMIAWTVVIRLLSLLTLRYVNHQKR